MNYELRKPKEEWRRYLTVDEEETVRQINAAQRVSSRMRLEMIQIRARANKRLSRARKEK